MTVIAPPPPKTNPDISGSDPNGPTGGFGGGDWDGDQAGGELPEHRYYTGMLIGLAGVTMLFAAFISAYVVRQGISDDWEPIRLPMLIWLNTGMLVASTWTLEKARRSFPKSVSVRRWWGITTLLGLGFLAGQLLVWRDLASQGVFVSTNPSSSFFYLLTGAHGIHLLGGVVALLYFYWRFCQHSEPPGKTALGATALYWHSMDGLWIFLLTFLLVWR